MDAHVQECTEVCGVISSLAGQRWSSRRCCWGRNEKAAVGRQRLIIFYLFLFTKIFSYVLTFLSAVLVLDIAYCNSKMWTSQYSFHLSNLSIQVIFHR